MKNRGVTLRLGLFLVAFLLVTSTVSAVNEVRIECPVVSPTAVAGDSIAIRVHMTNDCDVGGLTLGFHYNSDMVEITSIVKGTIFPIGTNFKNLFLPESNQVLIGWVDVGGEEPITPQAGGLAFTLYMKLLPGVNAHCVDIDSVYVPPAGPFIWVPVAGGYIKPGYVDCGTCDVVIPSPPPPYFFIHLSDPHIGAAGAFQRFTKLVEHINSLAPDFVLITGDLVDYGIVQSYWQDLETLLVLFQVPVYVCVGNHDWFLFGSLSPHWPTYSHYFDDYDVTCGANLHLILLNSGWNDDIDDPVSCGSSQSDILLPESSGLAPGQMDFLSGKLTENPGAVNIVAMHNPVICNHWKGMCADEQETNGCITRNRTSFMDLCRNQNVPLVLSGHTHSPYQYCASPDNHLIGLTANPSGGYWSNRNGMVPYLPMYVIGDACDQRLAYRKIKIVGSEIQVYPSTTVYPGHKNFEVSTHWNGSSWKSFPKDGFGMQRVGVDSCYSPLKLHSYDATGNHVGINSTGGVDFQITDAYYQRDACPFDSASTTCLTAGEVISLLTDSSQSYTFLIEASASCTLGVEVYIDDSEKGLKSRAFYPPVAADSGSVGRLVINADITDFKIRLDDNGDGVTDRTVQPDSVVAEKNYLCGDASGDNSIDISDVVYLIAYIFSGGSAPNPVLAGDANCDSVVDISDAVYLIAYIFSGGLAPCEGCK